jgi:DNA-binding HxlR family transcriptional regulator
VTHPGALVRTADGLTTKVLNERLGRLLRFGILEKTSYPEVPPRVEYQLTAFGRRFIVILDQIRALQDELQANGGLPAAADADRPVEQR